MKKDVDGNQNQEQATHVTTTHIQPLSQIENNNLKSSGEAFEFFEKMGNRAYAGKFEARFFWMIKTDGAVPTDQVLDELKRDGLISEISDKYTVHFTAKGVAKFRRSKI